MIDMFFLVPLFFLVLFVIGNMAGYLSKLNVIVAGAITIALAYYVSPVQAFVMVPIRNALWLGGAYTSMFYAAAFYLASLGTMAAVGMVNLYASHGKDLWR